MDAGMLVQKTSSLAGGGGCLNRKTAGRGRKLASVSHLTFKSCLSVSHYSNLFQEQNPSCKGDSSCLSLLLECSPTGAETMSVGSPLHHLQLGYHSTRHTTMCKVMVLDPGTTKLFVCINSLYSYSIRFTASMFIASMPIWTFTELYYTENWSYTNS